MRTPALLLTASLVTLAPPASLAQPTIADLAPADAVFAASVPSGEALRDAFDRTPLGELFQTPAYKAWLERAAEDDARPIMNRIRERLAEDDIDFSDVALAPGAMGVAIWARLDRTTGFPTFHTLAFADYHDLAPDLQRIFEETIEDSLDEGIIELDEEDFDDFIVYSISQIAEPDDEDPDARNDFGDLNDPMADAAQLEIFERTHVAWIGDAVLMSDDLDALLLAADRLRGEGDAEALRTTRAYAAAMDSIGESQAWAAAFIPPLAQAIRAGEEAGVFAAEQGPPIPELLRGSGLSETRTLALGLRLDTADAMVETPFAVTFDRPEGIYALFGASDGLFDPLAFVSADAAGVSQLHIRFDQIVPLIQRVVTALPDAMRQQAQGQVAFVLATLGPLLQVVGPEVTIVSALRRPFSPESQTGFVAIRTTDPRSISNLLQQFGANMGLRSRDFEGSEIWEPQGAAFLPIPVIGLGAGHLFLGPTESVEDALRLAVGGAGGALADEDRFEQAARPLEADAFLFSWTELPAFLEYQKWVFDNAEQFVRAQFAPMLENLGPDAAPNVNGDWREEFIRNEIEALKQQAESWPPIDPLIETLGDSAAEMRLVPGALTGRMLIYSSDR